MVDLDLMTALCYVSLDAVKEYFCMYAILLSLLIISLSNQYVATTKYSLLTVPFILHLSILLHILYIHCSISWLTHGISAREIATKIAESPFYYNYTTVLSLYWVIGNNVMQCKAIAVDKHEPHDDGTGPFVQIL